MQKYKKYYSDTAHKLFFHVSRFDKKVKKDKLKIVFLEQQLNSKSKNPYQTVLYYKRLSSVRTLWYLR